MFFRNIKILNILLAIMFFLFTFSTINTLIYNSNIKLIEKLSNNFYEEDSLIFTTDKRDFSFDEVYSILPDNTVLYGIIQSTGQDIRSISYKGRYEPPKLKSGRFFTEKDFNGNEFLAVIGENVPIDKIQDGKEYIQVHNFYYEVIGIIGYRMPTRLDNSIILSSNSTNFLFSDRYVVSNQNIQEIYNFLGNEDIFGQVFARPYKGVNVLHIIDRNHNQILLSILFLFILFINNISIMYFWVEHKKEEINIKRNNGYLKYQIMIDIGKEIFPILLCSIIIAILCSFVFLVYAQNYIFQFIPLILGLLINVVLIYSVLLYLCIYTMQKLKGDKMI